MGFLMFFCMPCVALPGKFEKDWVCFQELRIHRLGGSQDLKISTHGTHSVRSLVAHTACLWHFNTKITKSNPMTVVTFGSLWRIGKN